MNCPFCRATMEHSDAAHILRCYIEALDKLKAKAKGTDYAL